MRFIKKYFKKEMKKGISPLIATVLIIGFTIVVAALVFTWGIDLFKKVQGETSSDIEVKTYCMQSINPILKNVGYTSNRIEAVIDNTGKESILGFRYRLIMGDKITNGKATKATDAYGVTKYVIGFPAGAIPSLVEFFPIVKIKNKEYTCERTLSKNNLGPVAGYNEAGLSLDYTASGGSSCGDGSIASDLGEECDYSLSGSIFPPEGSNCATYFDNYVVYSL